MQAPASLSVKHSWRPCRREGPGRLRLVRRVGTAPSASQFKRPARREALLSGLRVASPVRGCRNGLESVAGVVPRRQVDAALLLTDPTGIEDARERIKDR